MQKYDFILIYLPHKMYKSAKLRKPINSESLIFTF